MGPTIMDSRRIFVPLLTLQTSDIFSNSVLPTRAGAAARNSQGEAERGKIRKTSQRFVVHVPRKLTENSLRLFGRHRRLLDVWSQSCSSVRTFSGNGEESVQGTSTLRQELYGVSSVKFRGDSLIPT